MRTVRKSLLCAALAAAVASRNAHGASQPVLVVVESAPGVAVDARDVRQAIEAELGVPVLAPTDATAASASNVLIVAVDRTDIRMSLRGSADGLVSRTIPAPLDRPARMREIGWLAGNLARDQVSGIVAAPAERGQLSPPRVVASADAIATTELPSPASSPENHKPAAVQGAEPAATIAGSTEFAPGASVSWLVTVAGGPTSNTYELKGEEPSRIGNNDYQVEIERQSSNSRLVFGAALDVGAENCGLGLAGFLGSRWRHGHWFLEATAGIGLAFWTSVPHMTVTTSPLTGVSSVTTVSPSADSEPAPFARGVGELGYSITPEVDLLARVGGHLATLTDTGGSWSMDFITAGAGLRVRLP